MTSKSLFFNLMKEDIKRRLWAAALLSLGFFLFYPVVAAFTAGEIRESLDYAKGLAEYESNLCRWLSFNCGMTVFLMMVSALICGLSSFSFLNSKSKVDFYHGLPLRRERLFAVNFLDGILILAVPYGVCQVMAVLVGIANGANGSRLWQVALAAYGFHVTYYILMYATVVVAAMMTGHLVVGFLGSMVLVSYMPMASMLLVGYLQSFFYTYSNRFGLFSDQVLIRFLRISPVAEYIYQMEKLGQDTYSAMSIAGVILTAWIISLLLAALSCFLYRKRPSEAAGRAMAFPVTRPVIRILLTVLSALGLGLFFYAMRSSMGWAVFGILFGGGICHCVVEIIYHFDFRKLFSDKLQLAGCLVLSLLLLAVFKYDLLGYDRYLPKAGQVRETSVYVSRLTEWVSYGHTSQYSDGHYEWDYDSDQDYVVQNMKYPDIENVLDIASEGIRLTEERKDRGTYPGSGYYYYPEDDAEEGEIWSQVEICYTLKSGRRVCRVYHMPIDGKIRPAMKKMVEDKAFQQGIYPIMSMTAEQVDCVRVRGEYSRDEYAENEICLAKLSPEKKAQMLEAYQREFSALTLERMEKEAPIGLIRFTKRIDEDAMDWWERQEAGDFKDYPKYRYRGWGDLINKDYYPIYPSFAETIRLLQEQGVKTGGYLDNLEVRRIQVCMPEAYRDSADEWDEESVEYGSSADYVAIWEPDPEELKKIKELSVYEGLCYYDPFFRKEALRVSLMIWDPEEAGQWEDEEDSEYWDSIEVVFPEGQVPDFVRE